MARDVSPLSLMHLFARRQHLGGTSLGFFFPFFPLSPLIFYYFLSCAAAAGSLPGIEYDYGISPKFVCTPIPPEADPSCYSPPSVPHGPASNGHTNGHTNGHSGTTRRGTMSDEAKATILHLRESLVRQKETILDQRETIRELTAKLTLCEGFGGHHSVGHHGNHLENHHEDHHDSHHDDHQHHGNHHPPSSSSHHGPSTFHSNDHHYSHGGSSGGGHSSRSDTHHRKVSSHSKHNSFSPEQTGKTLQTLKERLENLQQARNSSSSYSSSLRELLQRKINALEEQLHSYHRDHHDYDNHNDNHGDHHDDHHDEHHGSSHHDDHHDDDHHDDHYNDHHGYHDDHHGGHHDDHDAHHLSHSNHDDHHDDHHDNHHGNVHHDNHQSGEHLPRRLPSSTKEPSTGGTGHNKLETVLNQLHHVSPGTQKKLKSPNAFMLDFPMRTNYMYARMKRSVVNEIFAMTICLRLKSGAGPGLGTPFSYAVAGQANELVLIEWGNNPMELLINDKAVTLPITMTDGKWHHVCITWTTRDGVWEAYQDGVKKGSGQNLSPWHPIKPGGTFILGQEQDTMGGRFDVTQSFMGELSDLQFWSRVLTPNEIYSQATCGGHLVGDIMSWSQESVELHGRLAELPFDPCH
ncbi:LOW QUALITY PROTEIN: neuronal pentraxin-1-like [Scomber scombrus]|uniref:LOW QUALITY PROTEIN: neuronal pentraxin-1-like n=1 Tax=Scomber scombrus TaxID=13677 RepID=UPI002DDBA742|nr:LOW QUALITY PROTEIN: neuronal pentraxin-1-like [Scomber scombrus]